MPGVVGHNHLDEHVPGEHLPLHLLGSAGFADLSDRLQRDLDVHDHLLQAAVGDEFLNGGLDGVFIAGVGVDHVPLRVIGHTSSASYTEKMDRRVLINRAATPSKIQMQAPNTTL